MSDSRSADEQPQQIAVALVPYWQGPTDHSLGPGWHLPPAPVVQTRYESSQERSGYESYPSNTPTHINSALLSDFGKMHSYQF